MYSTRNLFYIRISKGTVLPMYLYLDERHVKWMSDMVLQRVLADLQPFILPKLRAEYIALRATGSAHKPSVVDTYRGDTYQFCYFIRKTEPHSVVIKSRKFQLVPPSTQATSGPSEDLGAVREKRATATTGRGKRPRAKDTTPSRAKPTKRKRVQSRPQRVREGSDDGEDDDDDDEYIPDSSHQREDSDVEMLEPAQANTVELEIEEQEEKPKPRLQLSYSGFSIYGQCLCVVVEPWSDPSAQPTLAAEPGPANQRKEMPLFLPEDDDDNDGELQLLQMEDGEDNMYGMLAMSQVLQSGGDTRTGEVHDDEGGDEAILFGDADEARNL